MGGGLYAFIKFCIIGLILFVIPSFYFDGFETLKNLLYSVLGWNNITSRFPKTFYYIIREIVVRLGLLSFDDYMRLNIDLLVRNVIVIWSIFLFLITKEKWQKIFLLSFVCAHFVLFNITYNNVYYLSPFLIFMLEKNEILIDGGNFVVKSKINLIYLILFIFLFMAYNSYSCFSHQTFVYVIMLLVSMQIFIGFICKLVKR